MTARTLCLTLALTLLGVCSSGAQTLTKTGTSAAAFLKIGLGSRALGMGGAFTATADDNSAMYWNPSGLARIYGSEATFNHVNWFADVRVDFAGFSTRLSDLGVLGAFVTVMSMDEMDVRTIEMPTGTGERFSAGALAVGLSYARNLTESFSIGFNVKYLREYIWNSSASGIALDAGVLYRIPVLNEFRLAAAISNFGTKMKLEGRDNLVVQQVGSTNGNLINTSVEVESYDLPLLFRVGVAADVVKSEDFRVTAALDAIHPNDNTEYLNTGIEATWKELVFLRGGWKSLLERDTEQGFTLGAGIQAPLAGALRATLDYAYQDWGRLTGVHYLAIGIKF
jgi:opacity protein-like surface antigen